MKKADSAMAGIACLRFLILSAEVGHAMHFLLGQGGDGGRESRMGSNSTRFGAATDRTIQRSGSARDRKIL